MVNPGGTGRPNLPISPRLAPFPPRIFFLSFSFFADLSSGAHSPSIISQGRIGALVTAKPSDRRTILEEAAGIAGLHVRRHEAELRLGAAENNLKRADELRRQQEKQ